MNNSILKELEFSTQEEFEGKLKILTGNKRKIEIYLLFWGVVAFIGVAFILSTPRIPPLAIFALIIPIFSCANQMVEYGNAIEKIKASAKK